LQYNLDFNLRQNQVNIMCRMEIPMNASARALTEKIQLLDANPIAAAQHFVVFLCLGGQERSERKLPPRLVAHPPRQFGTTRKTPPAMPYEMAEIREGRAF
jgi:hypothetical protein